MGKLLKEIRDTQVRVGKPPRKLDTILENLGEQDRTDLLTALDDHSISPTVIARVLRNNGFDITRTAIQRFRGLYGS